MRIPGRKPTTAFSAPNILDRPRLGMSRATAGMAHARATDIPEHAPAPEAALPAEAAALREEALIETGAALTEAPATPRTEPAYTRELKRFYVPLKLRVLLTFLAGTAWLAFSVWLSRHWIERLGSDISLPLAIVVVSGIALIPGYLNVQLLTSILLDTPPHLRMDVEFPRVALLIAAYNEQESIAETLDYALRSDYPGSFEVVVSDDGSSDATREIVAQYARG